MSAARFDPTVEAAFMTAYGLDTLDPKVTPRRMLLLLKNMRPGVINDEHSAASWSVESHLLAAVVDSVNQLGWLTAAVNAKHKPRRPKPLKRPGDKPKARMRPMDLAGALEGREGVVS